MQSSKPRPVKFAVTMIFFALAFGCMLTPRAASFVFQHEHHHEPPAQPTEKPQPEQTSKPQADSPPHDMSKMGSEHAGHDMANKHSGHDMHAMMSTITG